MQLKLTKVQLILRLHELLKYSHARPILITSPSYVEFIEKTYGMAVRANKYQA